MKKIRLEVSSAILVLMSPNGTALCRRDNRIPSAGTVAKFIIKSLLLLLLLNYIPLPELGLKHAPMLTVSRSAPLAQNRLLYAA
jgi:hypothetical protein